MRVKLLNTGGYDFGAEFVGQELPAKREGSGVRVTFPREVTDSSTTKDNWYYSLTLNEVEIIEE